MQTFHSKWPPTILDQSDQFCEKIDTWSRFLGKLISSVNTCQSSISSASLRLHEYMHLTTQDQVLEIRRISNYIGDICACTPTSKGIFYKTRSLRPAYTIIKPRSGFHYWTSTVELQWLKHLWGHRNLFEIWVVRATEG